MPQWRGWGKVGDNMNKIIIVLISTLTIGAVGHYTKLRVDYILGNYKSEPARRGRRRYDSIKLR